MQLSRSSTSASSHASNGEGVLFLSLTLILREFKEASKFVRSTIFPKLLKEPLISVDERNCGKLCRAKQLARVYGASGLCAYRNESGFAWERRVVLQLELFLSSTKPGSLMRVSGALLGLDFAQCRAIAPRRWYPKPVAPPAVETTSSARTHYNEHSSWQLPVFQAFRGNLVAERSRYVYIITIRSWHSLYIVRTFRGIINDVKHNLYMLISIARH